MKTWIFLAQALLVFQVNSAEAKSAQPAGGKDSSQKAQLGTSFRFDGSSLHGKFQNSPSLTATVENDKFLDDLLGARKHFRDRLTKDRDRN